MRVHESSQLTESGNVAAKCSNLKNQDDRVYASSGLERSIACSCVLNLLSGMPEIMHLRAEISVNHANVIVHAENVLITAMFIEHSKMRTDCLKCAYDIALASHSASLVILLHQLMTWTQRKSWMTFAPSFEI